MYFHHCLLWNQVSIYAGAVFIQMSMGWDMYLSIAVLLLVTGLFTVLGKLYVGYRQMYASLSLSLSLSLFHIIIDVCRFTHILYMYNKLINHSEVQSQKEEPRVLRG